MASNEEYIGDIMITASRKLFLPFRDKFQEILFVAFCIYVIVWSILTVMRYYSLNSAVFDLGVAVERSWQVYNITWTVPNFLYYFFNSGIVFVVFPLSFAKSIPLFLIFQSLFIGIAAFPIYGISNFFLKKRSEALLISISYLIYFPISGINWFDFHYQMMFTTLFIFAYYFYLKGKYFASGVLFILSGMVRFPYAVFPALFSFVGLLGLISPILRRERPRVDKQFIFLIMLLAVSVFFLVGGYMFVLSVTSLSSGIHSSLYGNFSDYLSLKILTVALLFGSLLFIPFLSKKWFLLYLPFIFTVFSSNYWGYFYPYIFQLQYTSGIVPFLFLGLIDGLHVLKKRKDFPQLRIVNVFKFLHGHRKVLISTLLLIVISFAMFFQPYGPLNSYTYDNYNLKETTNANFTLYNELEQTLSLIPKNNEFVLIQNNLPQALPRPYTNGIVLIPALVNNSVSLHNVMENSFPISFAGSTFYTHIDYVLADSNNYNFKSSFSGSLMYRLVNLLLLSGQYGIISEESGILLLERGFTGPPKYFNPLQFTGNYPTQITAPGAPAPLNINNINILQNISLLPGSYEAHLFISNTSLFYLSSANISLYLNNDNGYTGNFLLSSVKRVHSNETEISYSISLDRACVNVSLLAELQGIQTVGAYVKLTLKQLAP